MTYVHHSAIHAKDVDASLRFYRDGLGLQVLMDQEFDGDWRALFDVPADRLRSVFLGGPTAPDAGIVELVAFDGARADEPDARQSEARVAGFFLLSFFVDVDDTLARLGELGFDAPVSRIRVRGPEGDVEMATVRDPDGVLVELVGARSSREALGLGTARYQIPDPASRDTLLRAARTAQDLARTTYSYEPRSASSAVD